MTNKNIDDLLKFLSISARRVTRGKYGKPEMIFELAKTKKYPERITELAESFGMMIVKVEARDFRLEKNIKKLKKQNEQLQKVITEREQVEKKIKMLAHAVMSITECVSVTDMDQNIIFTNDAFQKTYGYAKHELIGKSIKVVRSPNNASDLIEEIYPATLSGGWQGELLNRRMDGSEFPISLSASVVRDENETPIALIGITRDITERKQAAGELKKHRENLEQLVKERTSELEEKNKELEHYNRLFEGREFRIKELKDKVKELEEKLSG